ncbi:MAG: sodium:proton antiporter, partial [Candidatus Hinthialibacter sp.]
MKQLFSTLTICLILGWMSAALHASALDAAAEPVLIAQNADGAGEPAAPHESAAPADGEHAAETHAEDGHGAHPNLGENLPLWSTIPFIGILLSIALFPLFAPHFWHHHFPKISFLWALILAVPFLFVYQADAVYEILHIYILDYIPFIILLWSLYTISGGILLRGTLVGTPMLNTIMILIGAFLASWMGTTGAAMLLIRPFLRANKHRKNRTFMVVFFIFQARSGRKLFIRRIGGLDAVEDAIGRATEMGRPTLFV